MKIERAATLPKPLREKLNIDSDTRVNLKYSPMHPVVWNLESELEYKFRIETTVEPEGRIERLMVSPAIPKPVTNAIKVIFEYEDPAFELRSRMWEVHEDDLEESIRCEMACRASETTTRNRQRSARITSDL